MSGLSAAYCAQFPCPFQGINLAKGVPGRCTVPGCSVGLSLSPPGAHVTTWTAKGLRDENWVPDQPRPPRRPAGMRRGDARKRGQP